MEPAWGDMALVGRIARAHGVRGAVIVNPETDFPEARFRPGSAVWVLRVGRLERLQMQTVRWHDGRPIISFAGVDSIEAAEQLAGAELRVPVAQLAELGAGLFYRHDLIGCRVVTTESVEVGVVAEVEGSRDASRLVVRAENEDILVPLAQEICLEIDLRARRIVIAAPEGLLELNRRRKGT